MKQSTEQQGDSVAGSPCLGRLDEEGEEEEDHGEEELLHCLETVSRMTCQEEETCPREFSVATVKERRHAYRSGEGAQRASKKTFLEHKGCRNKQTMATDASDEE